MASAVKCIIKLSTLIRSGLSIHEQLKPDAKIRIGHHTFNLAQEDPDVRIVPVGIDTYDIFIEGFGSLGFHIGGRYLRLLDQQEHRSISFNDYNNNTI